MAERSVFSTKASFWIFAIGVLSFLGAMYVSIYEDEFEPGRTVGANAFSYSALGHRAFVETLEKLDVPVTLSRFDSVAKANRAGALALIEPRFEIGQFAKVRDYLAADRVLLVLPKWFGLPDAGNPHWIGYFNVLKPDSVQELLQEVVPDATLARVKDPGSWTLNAMGARPTLENVQLIKSSQIKPVVASEHGILLGQISLRGSNVWILSDPDVLSNHGIGKGANAEFSVLLADLVRNGGRLVVDETSHGFKIQPTLWKAMFEHPFLFVTIQAFATILVLLGAVTIRFGAPRPVAPALAPGKAGLIANTADLLHFGGHDGEIMQRYVAATVRAVARRLHAPRHLNELSLYGWLDRVAENRKIELSVGDLVADADRLTVADGGAQPRMIRLAQLARRLHRWKREMTDGSAGDRGA